MQLKGFGLVKTVPDPPWRLLITGDRIWDGYQITLNAIEKYKRVIQVIIHGDCQGADTIAASAAKIKGVQTIACPADWHKYGAAAGPIRNRQMIQEHKPNIVWAFHDDLPNSKGTRDMINAAKRAGLPVFHFSRKTPKGVPI